MHTSSIFEPPRRLLLGPGPSPVHPQVMAALAKPTLSHLDPAYLALMDTLQERLRRTFRTSNERTLALPGTGTSGMEAALVNLIEPGDVVLCAVIGGFGARMAEIAGRAGAAVSRIDQPWGEVFSPDDFDEPLGRLRPKLVTLVLAETSTGAWQPLAEIAKRVHAAGALLVVDAVTALGGLPVEVDALRLDVVYSCSQKCLGCPPGLSPITFSPAALESIARRRTLPASWYLDVTLLGKYWGPERVYHHTAPSNLTYALVEGLRLLEEEGLEASFARHAANQRALAAGLEALGLDLVAAPGHRLPMLTAVRVPEGLDDKAIRRTLLERHGIEIGGGLGVFAGKIWRIGLMGHGSRRENVEIVLAALGEILREQGVDADPLAAIAAAKASA